MLWQMAAQPASAGMNASPLRASTPSSRPKRTIRSPATSRYLWGLMMQPP
ncbi:hypothetical protein CBOM_05632 [Ceraceosorus bombacis]|uniref:Uncharacterized protein n=1 Tax=Ceraceosorus bombacis TaxID=401625 RepID=A0A0P1BRM7_9BASI|nr:hypothetical protein CBOM_05632 [Ceraceosorus bombacis]